MIKTMDINTGYYRSLDEPGVGWMSETEVKDEFNIRTFEKTGYYYQVDHQPAGPGNRDYPLHPLEKRVAFLDA
jgi:hypothetical protein